MEARAAAVAAGEARELVWLLEHPPVYTAGTSADPVELVDPRFPVFQTGRGGKYTYHGPGQRTGYLILDLGKRGRDVRHFVHTLEDWLIAALGRLGSTLSGPRGASASGRGTAARRPRSARSACACVAGSRCTALRSTSRPIFRISAESCPAACPNPRDQPFALNGVKSLETFDEALAFSFPAFLKTLASDRQNEA